MYLGDSARCPYGPRSSDRGGRLRAADRRVAGRARDVKLDRHRVQHGHGGRPRRMRSENVLPCRSSAWWGAGRPGGGPCDAEPARGGDRHEGHGGVGRLQRGHPPSSTPASPCSPRRRRGSWRSPSMGLQHGPTGPIEDLTWLVSTKVYIRPAFEEIARRVPGAAAPLRHRHARAGGARTIPLLKALIGGVVGREVTLVLVGARRRPATWRTSCAGAAAAPASEASRAASTTFFTTGEDVEEFRQLRRRACSPAPWTSSRAWDLRRAVSHCPQRRGARLQGEGASPYEGPVRHRQRTTRTRRRRIAHGARTFAGWDVHARWREAGAGHLIRPRTPIQLRGATRAIKARAARAAARASLGRFVAVLADDSGLGGGRAGRRAGGASRRATRGPSRATTRRTTRSCWPSLAAVPDAEAHGVGSCARSCSSTRTVRNRWRAATIEGSHRARGARGGRGLRLRPAVFARRVRRHACAGRGLPGREERHISSRKCLARAQKGPFPKR